MQLFNLLEHLTPGSVIYYTGNNIIEFNPGYPRKSYPYFVCESVQWDEPLCREIVLRINYDGRRYQVNGSYAGNGNVDIISAKEVST